MRFFNTFLADLKTGNRGPPLSRVVLNGPVDIPDQEYLCLIKIDGGLGGKSSRPVIPNWLHYKSFTSLKP